MKSLHRSLLTTAAAIAASLALTSQAAPILGAKVLVDTDGEVIAKFLGHTAGFSNDLYLDAPANALGIIFNNQTTPPGTTVSLGTFTAGTELEFRIYVNNTGYSFYTGPAARNPDGLEHAVVDDAYSPTETYVGFEDIFGGGDLDYDDLKFSFTNVRGVPSVPDAASTSILLGLGMIGLTLLRRRSA